MSKRKGPKPLTVKPRYTLAQTMDRFQTEDACRAYLKELRWPDGVVKCPRCKSSHVREVAKKPWHWQCRQCNKNGYRFSITTGTIFENTKYPLRTWFQVAYIMSQAKKGISALQVHREIGSGSYETAWFMCHRIRAAMRGSVLEPLTGEVEADETWIGGKDKNRHWHKRSHSAGPYASNKTAVLGAISRKGNVVAQMADEIGFRTLENFIKETVSNKVSVMATDENFGYRHLAKLGYPHKAVNHSKHKYVVGAIHTNTIEGFWSLVKRGIVGSYHKVGREYLPMYLNEFSFRYNNRNNPDIFRDLLSGV